MARSIASRTSQYPAHPVSLDKAIAGEPQLQEAGADSDADGGAADPDRLKARGPLSPPSSTHAAGVVIGDRPLAELVPLYRDPRSDGDSVQHEMGRTGRAREIRLSRPEDADRLGPLSRFLLVRAASGSISRRCHFHHCLMISCSAMATPSGCSRSKARACATCSKSCAPTASRTSSRWCPSTARGRWRTSRATSRSSMARRRLTTCTPRSRGSSRKPMAS